MNQIAEKCLDEVELLALANGEAPSGSTAAHLRGCPSCMRNLDDARAQLTAIREADSDARALGEDGLAARPRSAAEQGRDTRAGKVKNIGAYQVIEELGSGGQARVYRALHPTLACEVVLKVGHEPVPAADQADDRIVREARLLKELRHPNLAQVHDLFFDNDRPVLVLEFVRGRSLRQLSRQKKFTPREAAVLIAKIARALEGAHARGIFHRDITPSNIMIDEKGESRLIDFGLARYRHAWGEGVEVEGLAAGTLGFMPPEQYEALHDQIDARTDVFALGAVLRDVLRRADVGELGAGLGVRATAPPGARAGITAAPGGFQTLVHAVDWPDAMRRAGVPRRLRRIIEIATNPLQDQRYATTSDLAAELERFARSRRWLPWAIVTGIFVAALVVAWAGYFRPVPVPPIAQPLLMSLTWPDQPALIPLNQSPADFVQVDVPHGSRAVLAWIDPDGNVEMHTDLRKTAAGASPYDRYELWRDNHGFDIGKFNGGKLKPDPAGWKVILVFALPDGAGDAEIDRLKADLESLAPKNEFPAVATGQRTAYAFRFGASDKEPGKIDAVASQLRGTDTPAMSAEEEGVKSRVGKLQDELRKRGYRFFTGIAVPYAPRGE